MVKIAEDIRITYNPYKKPKLITKVKKPKETTKKEGWYA